MRNSSTACSSKCTSRPGLAVGDDLGDAADVGGHHGGPAGHRLQVHDARAARTPTGRRTPWRADSTCRTSARGQHAGAPRTPRSRSRCSSATAFSVSSAISGVSGAPAQQHDLDVRVDLRGGRGRRWTTPFCRVMRPTNDHAGAVGVDAGRAQRVARRVGVVEARCRCRCGPRAPAPGPAPGSSRGCRGACRRSPRSPRRRPRRPSAPPTTRAGSRRRAARPSTVGAARASAR